MNGYVNVSSPGYIYINITNHAGYIARFKVSYILRGKVVKEQSRNLSLEQSDKLFVPEESTSIILEIEESIVFGWRQFHYEKFKGPVNKCYSLSGTAFNPTCTQINCVD